MLQTKKKIPEKTSKVIPEDLKFQLVAKKPLVYQIFANETTQHYSEPWAAQLDQHKTASRPSGKKGRQKNYTECCCQLTREQGMMGVNQSEQWEQKVVVLGKMEGHL
mgnify:CR=1 FL=1